MLRIGIFEAAGCCATSSAVVNDEAVEWNANVEWTKKNGVDIQHCSLAKSSRQFLSSPVVKEFLNTSRMDPLPVTLLDGKLVMTGKLPTREDTVR